MRKTLIAKAALAASAVTLIAAPMTAAAQPHHHRYLVCPNASGVRRNANNGTIIGAVGGGLLGHAIGGHGAGGTLVGAGVGAVAGHQIAKNRARHNCHYEYR